MPLTIEKRMEDEVAVLRLEGSLTLGPSLVSLRNAAREALAEANLRGIVLDVQRIGQVDSSGLGELTIVYSSAARHNCGMRLVGVSSSLQKMFQMTHLDAVLASSEAVEQAKVELRGRSHSGSAGN